VEDTTSLLPLSYKFGASEDQCIKIMQLACDLNVDLVGCSFHAGTPCHSPVAYKNALHMAHRLFDIAYQQFNMTFKIVDIGGGFNPGHTIQSDTSKGSTPSFVEIASSISHTIDELYPVSRGNKNVSTDNQLNLHINISLSNHLKLEFTWIDLRETLRVNVNF